MRDVPTVLEYHHIFPEIILLDEQIVERLTEALPELLEELSHGASIYLYERNAGNVSDGRIERSFHFLRTGDGE